MGIFKYVNQPFSEHNRLRVLFRWSYSFYSLENAATWHTSKNLKGISQRDHVMILFGLISLIYHNLGSQKCPFTKPKEHNKIPPTLRPAKNPGTASLGTPNHGKFTFTPSI